MGVLHALTFLTAIPFWSSSRDGAANLSASLPYFPLVGLALGGVLAVLDWAMAWALPIPLRSAIILLVLALLTGGLHLDGLMDTCDGLFGGKTRERKLEIMRDSAVGSFGAAGAFLLLLVQWSALASLEAEARMAALILFPAAGRWAMTLVVTLFPYARAEGTGRAFHGGIPRYAIPLAAATTAVTSAVIAGRLGGIALYAIVTVAALLLGWGMARQLGGLTGDTYGATNQVVEAVALVTIVGTESLSTIAPLWVR